MRSWHFFSESCPFLAIKFKISYILIKSFGFFFFKPECLWQSNFLKLSLPLLKVELGDGGAVCTRSDFSVPYQRVTLDPETSKCPRQQKRNGDRGRQTGRNRAEGRGRALGTGWRGWGWEGWRRGSRPGVPGGAGQDPDSTGKGLSGWR